MKTKTKLTNGNTLSLEQLEGGDHRVAVVDRGGDVLSAWSGELPDGLADTLASTVFRLTRTCVVCGGSFRAKRESATTCSARCRTKAWRARGEAGSLDVGEIATVAATAAATLGAWIVGGRAYDAARSWVARRSPTVLVGEPPREAPPADRVVGGRIDAAEGGGWRVVCACGHEGEALDDLDEAEHALIAHLLAEHGAGS